MSIRWAAHRRINRRWAAPAVALLAIAGISLGPDLLSASASPPNLPPLTPAELLAKARTAQVTALSGTVELTSNLGLPSLDSLGSLGGGGDTSVASLLSGTHSAKVWMDGPDKVRVATSAPLAETNWIRNGTDVWSYESETLTATHATIPAELQRGADEVPGREAGPTSSVPDPVHDNPVEFAQSLLDKVTPSTTVSVDSTKRVAGRDAYQLVLSPNAPESTIGQVTLAVDAATGLPLDVKVTAKSSGDTAFELGFTDISFATPPSSTFQFTPPPEARVVEAPDVTGVLGAGGRGYDEEGHHRDRGGTSVGGVGLGSGSTTITVGADWTTVAIVSGATIPNQLGPILQGAEQVTVGSTGGRMITTKLFNVLVLDDGRVAIGAVRPDALVAAVAGAPA